MSVNLDLLVNLTENMFSLPIENFSEFFYNGNEVEKTVNLTECTNFANYQTAFQSCDIYAGRKIIYSCSVTKIYNIPVITDIFKNGEKVYEADMEKLDNEMSANMDIVKAYRINTLVEMLDESIKAAEESLTSTYTDVIRYENYKYNIGRCNALLDVLLAVDKDLFGEHFDKYIERTDKSEQEANGIRDKLRNAMEKFELEG